MADVQFGPGGIRSFQRDGDTGVGTGDAFGLIEKKLCTVPLRCNVTHVYSKHAGMNVSTRG